MLDKYLNESVKTSEKSVDIEVEVKKPKKKFVEEEEEMVSTRFIDFYPKKHKGRRRLSDFFENSENDDWEEEKEEVEEKEAMFGTDDWYEAAQTLMNVRDKVKERKQEEKKYDSIDDYRIAQLIDDENWLFYLGGMVASDEITDQEFFRYKRIIEETLAKRNKEDDKEELSTIGEVIKVKEEKVKESVKPVNEVKEEDPYMSMLRALGGDDYVEEIEEEPKKEKEELTKQEAELLDEFLEMDDDIEGGMRPEDFISQNAEMLGYEEEDEMDPETDKILARIKRVTDEQLKAMENEMFDDEDDEDDVPTLEIFEPEESKNKEEKVVEEPKLEIIEPEVEMKVETVKVDKVNKNNTIYPKNTIKAKYRDKEGNIHVSDNVNIESVSSIQYPDEEERREIENNIFKVQRKVETVEMKVDGEDVKGEKEETKTKITEVNVYDKPLPEEDIAKLYQKTFDEKDPETKTKITEVNVYDKPLPEEDIAKLYQKTFDEKDPETEKMGPDVTDTEEIEETFPDQKAIMETIAKAHKQTQELEKDYDHYEDEYGYLYDEEDTMKNKGKNGKGWK